MVSAMDDSVKKEISIIKNIYSKIKYKIIERLDDFKNIFEKGSEEDIFLELVFCILTPQSKAKTCWNAALDLKKNNFINCQDQKKISDIINNVRFKNNKARYIIESRNKFLDDNKDLKIKSIIRGYNNILELRDWLVKNIKGIGYKEASHFLRNIGLGNNIAILDRHILKNLKLLNLIEEIPLSITPTKYFDIEKRMIEFSKKIDIPVDHLDFILWYKEANDVFK